MDYYIVDEYDTGDILMREFRKILSSAMADCGYIAEAMSDWDKKYQDLQARPDWLDVS